MGTGCKACSNCKEDNGEEVPFDMEDGATLVKPGKTFTTVRVKNEFFL